MNCSPKHCPHAKLMEQARNACLGCDHIDPAGHGGTISADAAGERVVHNEVNAEVYRSTHEPSEQVTALPAEVEGRLRILLAEVFGMETLDALLLFHVANGGTTNTFGEYLIRIVQAAASYTPERPSFRATVWLWWQRIIARNPAFAVLRDWSDHGRRNGKSFAEVRHNTNFSDHQFGSARRSQHGTTRDICDGLMERLAAEAKSAEARLRLATGAGDGGPQA